MIEGLHRDHGVELILGDAVAAFEGRGRVERVVTRSGRRVECDFAVFGLGIEPATDVVAGTGVRLDNGIVVDDLCRSSVPSIFAAGDVANHYHPVCARHMRVEHWQNGDQAGRRRRPQHARPRPALRGDPLVLVRSVRREHPVRRVPRGRGHGSSCAADLAARKFLAFYLTDGRVESVVAINQGRDLRRALPIIKARVAVDPARLADPAVDLRTLAPASAPLVVATRSPE